MGDKAGFLVRKWVSNCPEVLEDVPEKDRAFEVDLEKNQFPVTRTLGVAWSAQNDQFLFYHSPPSEDFEYTKRNVLKKTAALFDPLGFLGPFVVKAKLFVQQAWVEALQWDDPLTLFRPRRKKSGEIGSAICPSSKKSRFRGV